MADKREKKIKPVRDLLARADGTTFESEKAKAIAQAQRIMAVYAGYERGRSLHLHSEISTDRE